MKHLADELWQQIVDYSTEADRRRLRCVSTTLWRVLARLAFPRRLTRSTSLRWLCDPAFQDVVAATMTRPERDLDVRCQLPSPAAAVYTLSAAAHVLILGTLFATTLVASPQWVLRGPIDWFSLHWIAFTADCLDERVARCARLALDNCAVMYALPRQLYCLNVCWSQSYPIDVLRSLVESDTPFDYDYTIHTKIASATSVDYLEASRSKYRALFRGETLRLWNSSDVRYERGRLVFSKKVFVDACVMH